ncbi:MAG: hypothetical protein O8C63_13460 [Candidatus Methanoperedens sp.]|nr:hypothetical protein [Candidatus Methanoperedens sp.]
MLEKIDNVFREIILKPASPEPKKGLDTSNRGTHFSTKDLDKFSRKWYSEYTLIIGVNPESEDDNEWKGGWAEWHFKIDKKVIGSLSSAYLKISTIRTHGGLHSTKVGDMRGYGKKAEIYINEKKLDTLDLVTKTEFGEAYGISRVGPYPIIDYIHSPDIIVKLKVDPLVAWGIDEIRLELIQKTKKLRPWIYTFIGIVGGFLLRIIYEKMIKSNY